MPRSIAPAGSSHRHLSRTLGRQADSQAYKKDGLATKWGVRDIKPVSTTFRLLCQWRDSPTCRAVRCGAAQLQDTTSGGVVPAESRKLFSEQLAVNKRAGARYATPPCCRTCPCHKFGTMGRQTDTALICTADKPPEQIARDALGKSGCILKVSRHKPPFSLARAVSTTTYSFYSQGARSQIRNGRSYGQRHAASIEHKRYQQTKGGALWTTRLGPHTLTFKRHSPSLVKDEIFSANETGRQKTRSLSPPPPRPYQMGEKEEHRDWSRDAGRYQSGKTTTQCCTEAERFTLI